MARALRAWAINRRGKTWSVTYSTVSKRYTRAFTDRTSKWTSGIFARDFACSFIYFSKWNTLFRASLSIEKRGLWHLGTGKRSRSPAAGKALHLTLFMNSFIHLHIFQFNELPIPFNTLLCIFYRGQLNFFFWVNDCFLFRQWYGSGMRGPCKLDWYRIANAY